MPFTWYTIPTQILWKFLPVSSWKAVGVVLGPGASYSGSATVTVPGTVVGNHRWEVKTNVLGEVFEGAEYGQQSRACRWIW